MNIKKIFQLLALFLSIAIFVSCFGKNDEPKRGTLRTIVMYLVATNTLSQSIASDIAEVENAILSNDMNRCRVLVYHTTYSQDPCLYEIKKEKGVIKNVVVKRYSPDVKSTTVERMKDVLQLAVMTAPAEEYGLILGSHASGWASSLTSRSLISTLDFGDDNGSTMPIHELAEAIPSNTFDFIYCDACYMAGVEVAYELRNKTKYFIASTTELPVDGMDYKNNIPCFFADSLDLVAVCKNTFNKYNSKNGSSRTCTISLVDCDKLDDLASITHDMFAIGEGTKDRSSLQRYKRDQPYLFFDFNQYMNTFTSEDSEQIETLKTRLHEKLNDIVIYKAATPYIFNYLAIKKENYSGLSTYILGSTSSDGVNENYYKTLSWYKDVIE